MASFLLLLLIQSVHVHSQTWRNVLKINRGVSVNPNTFYKTAAATYGSFEAEESYANSLSYNLEGTNFRSNLINDWKDGKISVTKVRLRFCKFGAIQKFVVFSGSSLVWNTWLQIQYITSSSWTDLHSGTNPKVASIYDSGHWDYRFFYVWNAWPGCSGDQAWFTLTNINGGCSEWNEGAARPNIFYTTENTIANLQGGSTQADAFIIQIETGFQPVTDDPTRAPTDIPSSAPSEHPSYVPTLVPTAVPTSEPTNEPTTEPTVDPTVEPTVDPTFDPTSDPTFDPTVDPTQVPTTDPTEYPSSNPTDRPTDEPSIAPTPNGDSGGVGDVSTTSEGGPGGQRVADDASWMNDGNFLYLLILVICILACCICCLLIVAYYRKRQKGNRQREIDGKFDEYNKNVGIELHKVVSVSGTGTQMDTARLNSLSGTTQSIVPNAEPDVYSDSNALQMWLNGIGMTEYYDTFIEQGFGEQMATLNVLTDRDLQNIGITKMAHRKRILLQIEQNKHMINAADGPSNVYMNDGNVGMTNGQSHKDEEYEYYYEENGDGKDGLSDLASVNVDELYQSNAVPIANRKVTPIGVTHGYTPSDLSPGNDTTPTGTDTMSDPGQDGQPSDESDEELENQMYQKGDAVTQS